MHDEQTSIWPFFTALSSFLLMLGFMISFQWRIPSGGLLAACVGVAGLIISLTGWVSEIFGSEGQERLSTTAIIVFILSEIALFGGIFSAYLYGILSAEDQVFSTVSEGIPPLGFAMILTVILISSSVTIQIAEKKEINRWLSLTVALGILFLMGQAREWVRLIASGFTISSSSYGMYFYLITGLHGSHVLIGILFQLYVMFLASRRERFHKRIIRICGYYWHFVDGIWLIVLSLIYVLPYSLLKI